MLQQSVQRLARPAASALRTFAPCKTCACRCGVAFGGDQGTGSGSRVQKRWATLRKSPAAYNRESPRRRQKPSDGEPTGGVEDMKKWLAYWHIEGLFSTKSERVLEFLAQFQELQRAAVGSSTVDPKRMREIMTANDLVDSDCWNIPLLLGQRYSSHRYTSRKMMLSMSRAGVEEATIITMAQAVVELKQKPGILNAREIAYSRKHLSEIASQKLNFRAMVCEGRVARALGDEERAIEMWTDAMAAAIEDAERKEQAFQERKDSGEPGGRPEVHRDPLELSTPWIELMLLHRERSELRGKDEMRQCRWAMEIGCKQDDPTSFYHASTFVKQYDSNGNHLPTSEWLYYVTKAAASGHPIAAYDLARFYAESGWKYLEDEPPDHVKPTPFDSFPAPKIRSTLSRVFAFLGLMKRPEMKAEESLFHCAVFPSTAADRYALAIEWLDVAGSFMYAPAILYRAQLVMQKTLWGQADAPQAALSMSNDRYSYANRAAYEAGVPLDKTVVEEPADPPNPHYNLDHARILLREIFYAHEAHHYSHEVRRAYRESRRRGGEAFDDDDDVLDESMFQHRGFKIQKWFRYPEIREMNEDELEGLYTVAMRLCDEQGWDIYDDDNAIIYKAGSGKKRAPGKLYPTVRY